MFTFIVVLIFVFVGVDLLVRFVIEPLLTSKKKRKVSKAFAPRFDPTVKLATETMYDGGKPHNAEGSAESVKSESTPTETGTESK